VDLKGGSGFFALRLIGGYCNNAKLLRKVAKAQKLTSKLLLRVFASSRDQNQTSRH
jgi:hypothetical protein